MALPHTHGWFIIKFIEHTTPPLVKEILFSSNPALSHKKQSEDLKQMLHQRFNRLIDWDNDDAYRINTLSINGTEITLNQLVTYLKGLSCSSAAIKPDLLGFGTNEVVITWEWEDLQEVLGYR
ncbi:Similar to predicted protein [Laccaria bicolor S238N-H82]; acc. no. XP_001883044 [Pyronema omphalodes CBS 100304]|uniref:Uncharacterized protein n=1 Tax=Pyronema omphalodes (strain CBS 100304) TaxID=1076935 RepID=U4LC36_PYROM|nr:Similar to predicted protein [Laccaria bicolor S238N-H82]; acc. no. XP_001883044 [Pyronema omphalodes CBS 100304]